MASNALPLLAIAGAAFLLLSKSGDAQGAAGLPQGTHDITAGEIVKLNLEGHPGLVIVVKDANGNVLTGGFTSKMLHDPALTEFQVSAPGIYKVEIHAGARGDDWVGNWVLNAN